MLLLCLIVNRPSAARSCACFPWTCFFLSNCYTSSHKTLKSEDVTQTSKLETAQLRLPREDFRLAGENKADCSSIREHKSPYMPWYAALSPMRTGYLGRTWAESSTHVDDGWPHNDTAGTIQQAGLMQNHVKQNKNSWQLVCLDNHCKWT